MESLRPSPSRRSSRSRLGASSASSLLWRKQREDLVGFGGELDRAVLMPGWTNVWTMPIQNRVDMLSTGVIPITMGGNVPLLVVAPWLSKRTQELLAEQEINYIDLTGNALLQLDSPALYLQTVGESRNPAPKERGRAQLRGAKAARLIRLLADVRPPYGVRELAEAANLAPGYVSRLLDTLYREALIERSPRGPIERVDIAGLLRRWAGSYDVFKANESAMFVAPQGVDHLLPQLAADPGAGTRIAITGSFAATRLAPITSPALLIAYYDAPALIGRDFGLLPTEEGANVALLRPFDQVVWLRTPIEDGLRYAAPSQVVVDCLSGNGRMPAEGEALLAWMQANEPEWRADSLEALRP